jgi:hypothetical protein
MALEGFLCGFELEMIRIGQTNDALEWHEGATLPIPVGYSIALFL